MMVFRPCSKVCSEQEPLIAGYGMIQASMSSRHSRGWASYETAVTGRASMHAGDMQVTCLGVVVN